MALAMALALVAGTVLPAGFNFALGVALACAGGLAVAELRRHGAAGLPNLPLYSEG